MWDKIKGFFKNSVTIFVARGQVFVGAAAAAGLALLQDPNITAALQSLLQPKFVPYYVIAIGLVTELARRRSLGKAE